MTQRDTSSRSPRPSALSLQRFGATLRQYRKQRRLSQQALSTRTGIPNTYLSEIEHGRHNISVLMLLRLAQALEIPVGALLAPLARHDPLAPSLGGDPLPSVGMPEAVVPHNAMRPSQPHDPAALLSLLGTTLRQYRQQRDLSQAMLGTRAGLTPTYIGEIELGQRNLSLLSLVCLAEALELPVSHLLTPLETS